MDSPKACRVCGVTKPRVDFPRYGRECTACERARKKLWKAANAERLRAKNAAYSMAHREEINAAPLTLPAPAQRQLDREEITAAPPTPPAPAPRQLDREEIAVLLKRGKDLIANGDLAAARLVLQRAADANDVEATLALAATYDPFVLRELRIYSFPADAEMARVWYEKARELGSSAASRRLEMLSGALSR